MYDVIGISHCIVDICVEVNEEFLDQCEIEKGHSNVVDTDKFKKINNMIDKEKIKIELGGSVSNTLAGLHLLGCKVGEYGKIGKDKPGDLIKKEKKDKQMGDFISEHELPTGCCLTLITPDSERTFVVYLGAAPQLSGDDIDEEIIKQAKIIHTTGYEFESPIVRTAIRKTVAIAKENNIKFSLDLADPGVVQRNFTDLKPFIEKHVDILFANEEEAEEFTGKPAEEAVDELAKYVDYAIVKIGSKGSYIKVAHSGNTIKIDAKKVLAKDTTGAGDIYAAGILYGILNNLTMDEAGKIASHAAAEVVKKVGARLDKIKTLPSK